VILTGYLCTVMDDYSRYILSWRLSTTMAADVRKWPWSVQEWSEYMCVTGRGYLVFTREEKGRSWRKERRIYRLYITKTIT